MCKLKQHCCGHQNNQRVLPCVPLALILLVVPVVNLPFANSYLQNILAAWSGQLSLFHVQIQPTLSTSSQSDSFSSPFWDCNDTEDDSKTISSECIVHHLFISADSSCRACGEFTICKFLLSLHFSLVTVCSHLIPPFVTAIIIQILSSATSPWRCLLCWCDFSNLLCWLRAIKSSSTAWHHLLWSVYQPVEKVSQSPAVAVLASNSLFSWKSANVLPGTRGFGGALLGFAYPSVMCLWSTGACVLTHWIRSRCGMHGISGWCYLMHTRDFLAG